MDKFKTLSMVCACLANLALAGPGLEQAEVTMPYGELKALISGAARPISEPGPACALLSAKFRFSLVGAKLVMEAAFRTASFSSDLILIPLVGGNVSVQSQKPEDIRILIHEGMLCQVIEKAGNSMIETQLLPALGTESINLMIPSCPATIFETGELGDERSIILKIDGKEQVMGSNDFVAIPLVGGVVEMRMLGGDETREALRPPEPSSWTWQHQALVIPGDGEIAYRVQARASATEGSGVAASLSLPTDAREVRVIGEDLSGQKVVRGSDRSLALQIDWKTRGLLEREVLIFYQIPRRPLDRLWSLQAPAGPSRDETRARFLVVVAPDLSYAAEGLAGPFLPKGLPPQFTGDLKGYSCFQLEGAATEELKVNPLPMVATAEATIFEALWVVKLEPDGAMLAEGTMTVEHRGRQGMIMDIPPGMTLLACHAGGDAVVPVNLGDGKIEVNLPANDAKTVVSCSFTGRLTALDPVEGTLELFLPKTQLFIRALTWKIELPYGYQAETHGNLIRANDVGDAPSRLTLRKNLCRDERPETHVFYQRSDRNL